MSRTRSTTMIDAPLGPFYWRSYKKDGSLASTLTTNFQHTKVKSIVDNLTSGYFTKLREGEFLPINSVTISTVEHVLTAPQSGADSLKNQAVPNSTVVLYSGSFYSLANTSASLPVYAVSQSEIDNVVIKALAKAKTPEFDLLTFIGELPDTISLLANAFQRFNRLGRRVARRARRKERRRSRRERRPYDYHRAKAEFIQLWLEARYGWRPLIYDIQSICAALRKKAQPGILRSSARTEVDVSASSTGSTDNGQFKYTVTKTRTGKCKYRAVVYYRSTMSPIGVNPVLTAYELTKYSFVVDWFINIGAWIQALSPRLGFDQLGISISTVSDYTDSYVQVGTEGYNHTWSVGVSNQVEEHRYKVYSRSEYTGIPLPSIQVNLNKFKAVDLVALVLQGQRDISSILRL